MRVEGPKADVLVEQIIDLMSSMSGVLKEAAKLLHTLSEKHDLEYQILHRKSPVTNEEIEKDITLSKLEISLREREAAVRLLELQGREEAAKATKAEAVLRQRLTSVRQTQPSGRPQQKPTPVQGRPKPFPPLNEITNKGESVKDMKSSEGQLTHNLGDKLKSTQAS